MREATALCSVVVGGGTSFDTPLRDASQLPFDKLRAGLRMRVHWRSLASGMAEWASSPLTGED